jgi:hypothetical protein
MRKNGSGSSGGMLCSSRHRFVSASVRSQISRCRMDKPVSTRTRSSCGRSRWSAPVPIQIVCDDRSASHRESNVAGQPRTSEKTPCLVRASRRWREAGRRRPSPLHRRRRIVGEPSARRSAPSGSQLIAMVRGEPLSFANGAFPRSTAEAVDNGRALVVPATSCFPRQPGNAMTAGMNANRPGRIATEASITGRCCGPRWQSSREVRSGRYSDGHATAVDVEDGAVDEG